MICEIDFVYLSVIAWPCKLWSSSLCNGAVPTFSKGNFLAVVVRAPQLQAIVVGWKRKKRVIHTITPTSCGVVSSKI